MSGFNPEPRSPNAKGEDVTYSPDDKIPLLEKVDTEAKLAIAPWHDPKVERATVFGAQRLTRLRGLDLVRDPYLNKGESLYV